MRVSHFFIDRPIFAGVLSLLITILGAFAYFTLAVAQYPEVAPPTLQVTATYPGASADVVSETVATPLEQQINGIENLQYFSSQSTGDGKLTLTLTFRLGTDQQPCANAKPRAHRAATSSQTVQQLASPSEGCERLCNRSASLLAGRIARSALSLELCELHMKMRSPV
jgi:multidrug efflux pump subunit AcrB